MKGHNARFKEMFSIIITYKSLLQLEVMISHGVFTCNSTQHLSWVLTNKHTQSTPRFETLFVQMFDPRGNRTYNTACNYHRLGDFLNHYAIEVIIIDIGV